MQITTPANVTSRLSADRRLLNAIKADTLPEGVSQLMREQSAGSIHIENPYNIEAAALYFLKRVYTAQCDAELKNKKLAIILSDPLQNAASLMLHSLILTGQTSLDRAKGLKEPSFVIAGGHPKGQRANIFPNTHHDSSLRLTAAAAFTQKTSPLSQAARIESIVNTQAEYYDISPPIQQRQNYQLPLHHYRLMADNLIEPLLRINFMKDIENEKRIHTAFILTDISSLTDQHRSTLANQPSHVNLAHTDILATVLKAKGFKVISLNVLQANDGKIGPAYDHYFVQNLDHTRHARTAKTALAAQELMEKESAYLHRLKASSQSGLLPFPSIPQQLYSLADYTQALCKAEEMTTDHFNRELPSQGHALLDALWDGTLEQHL